MRNVAATKGHTAETEQKKEVLKASVAELEDQVRDITFVIEARDKVKSGESPAVGVTGGSLEGHWRYPHPC